MKWRVLSFRFTHRYEIFPPEQNEIHNIAIDTTLSSSIFYGTTTFMDQSDMHLVMSCSTLIFVFYIKALTIKKKKKKIQYNTIQLSGISIMQVNKYIYSIYESLALPLLISQSKNAREDSCKLLSIISILLFKRLLLFGFLIF